MLSVAGHPCELFALARVRAGATGPLHVYIEGDGAAWPSPHLPPGDPTPSRPVALALAAADPAPRVAYLGRPGQYPRGKDSGACDPAWWAERRFASPVVDGAIQAVEHLRRLTGATEVRLFGYSGGGIIAIRAAAAMAGVGGVTTIASPVSLAEWTRLHGVTAFPADEDPIQSATSVPGVHFAGADDTNVPPGIVAAYVRKHGGMLRVMPAFDHECCWVREWAGLLEMTK